MLFFFCSKPLLKRRIGACADFLFKLPVPLQEFFSLRGQYRLAAVAAAPVALYQRDVEILLGAL